MSPLPWIVRIGPGLAVAVVISLIALALERLEIGLIGAPLVDGLVFAILLGTAMPLRARTGERSIRLASTGPPQ